MQRTNLIRLCENLEICAALNENAPHRKIGAFFVLAYIQGESRSKTSLFPVSLEEWIPEDHLFRVIDTYVAKLALVRQGFDKAQPKDTRRPSYDPAVFPRHASLLLGPL